MQEFWSILLALGSAVLLGGLVGLERELHKHSAGLRTHMMVSLGSALFVQIGVALSAESTADMSRIIQGIAAGIGFIGAGTILKLTGRLEIRGLTTASSLWLSAAVGAGCGAHAYLPTGIAVGLSLVVLVVVGRLEKTLLNTSQSPAQDPPPPSEPVK